MVLPRLMRPSGEATRPVLVASETLILGWVWQQRLEDSGWTGAASVIGSGVGELGPPLTCLTACFVLGTVPGTGSSQTKRLLLSWSSPLVEKTKTSQCDKY